MPYRPLLLTLLALACTPKTAPTPPAAEAPPAPVVPDAPSRDHVHREHDVERPDPYYWMRDRDDPELIPYLEAENAYTEAQTDHLAGLRKTLYDEILGRIQEDDETVPAPDGEWWVWSKTEEGRAYRVHLRKKGEDGEPEVLLDQNVLAEGLDYFRLGALSVSPDHQRLAYAVDTTGRELFTVHVLDLATREPIGEPITDVTGDIEWANDSETLFYTTQDDTLRPHEVRRRAVSDPSTDATVYTEDDEMFRVGIYRTRSDAFLMMYAASSLTTEVHALPADEPDGTWAVIAERHKGHEYGVDHRGDHFWIRTNDCDDDQGAHTDCAMNFQVKTAKVGATGRDTWVDVVPHRDDVTIEDVEVFADHVVVTERQDGLVHYRILDPDTGEGDRLELPEQAYITGSDTNRVFDTDVFRFWYGSPVTPWSTYDADLRTGELTLLKEDPVIGYDRSKYDVQRTFATADDGTQVPITVVQRRGLGEGPHPTLLYGYGSYGIPMDPTFNSSRISLLDRGVVFAIAHIRGGGDNGRGWYEDGKFLHKRNTFTDFIACAKHLVAEGTTTSDQLAIQGGSAGGLLMGAVINMEPEMFRVAVASVPFVDVVTTMLDASIPLTTNEWEEWGNPADKEYFDYMLSYSPYDNVSAKPYPALLIESGLNDPRVQYWEPTKWTAKLRDVWTTDRPLLLKTNMGAGHGGNSGRYGWIEDQAFKYAFVLDQLAATERVAAPPEPPAAP